MCVHPLSFCSCLNVFCSVGVEIECTFQNDNEFVAHLSFSSGEFVGDTINSVTDGISALQLLTGR